MRGKGLVAGLKKYLGALLVTVVFPLQWMRSLRLARRHKDADPRAVAKVGIAIVLSIVIAAAGAYVLVNFQRDALWNIKAGEPTAQGEATTVETGIYRSLDDRLKIAIGEKDYQEQAAIVATKPGQITRLQELIDEAEAAGNEALAAERTTAKAALEKELADAKTKMASLEPNHALYDDGVRPLILAQDDAAMKDLLASTTVEYPSMDANVAAAFAAKDEAVRDMHRMMWFFVWPSLVGAFFAPVAFAHGSILRKAFEESDSVGYKPYPGAAAGFFLLFGAFGLPSIPFAAWTFLDAEQRSVEGQIAL